MRKLKKLLALVLSLIVIGGTMAASFAASAAENPVLELVKTGEDGNVVTVAVNVVSGKFNAMDFTFNLSAGVKCESILSQGKGIITVNTANCKISMGSVDGYSKGTVITASFIVPENDTYAISGSVTSCTVAEKGRNVDVLAVVTGSVTGGSSIVVPGGGETEKSFFQKVIDFFASIINMIKSFFAMF